LHIPLHFFTSRLYDNSSYGEWGMGHGAWGMGHGAWAKQGTNNQ